MKKQKQSQNKKRSIKEYIGRDLLDEEGRIVGREYSGRLIRCKDCKFYGIYELKSDFTDDERYNPSVCLVGRYAVKRRPNWYCADAEGRDDIAYQANVQGSDVAGKENGVD